MKSNFYNKKENYEIIFLSLFLLVFSIFSFFILKDVIVLIAYSFLLSYYLIPIFNYFNKKKINESLSSILALMTFVLFILIPLIFFLYYFSIYSINFISQYKSSFQNPEMLNQNIQNFLSSKFNITINFNLTDLFLTIVKKILNLVVNMLSSLPKLLINFFVILFISYYILVYYKDISKLIRKNTIIEFSKIDYLLKNTKKNLDQLFKGYVLTGLIQSIVAVFGYFIISAPNLLILFVLTFLFSLLPYVGAGLVWIPLSLYFFIIGETLKGAILFIYGVLIISTIDNFVRPYLMSNEDSMTPPVVFLGFLGGMTFLGVPGIILGPIILTITIDLFKLINICLSKNNYFKKD